jgi:peptide-methionine (S)-S-oxide reductase
VRHRFRRLANRASLSQGDTAVKKATFGAGCFWGIEATFRQAPGVFETAVGYSGGHLANPTYENVCTDRTGHAEVVRVEYDPAKVSFEQLLEVFWMSHDPTQLNRQGPDFGSQYRSVIFYHDEEQKREAEASKAQFESLGRYRRPIVTQIVPEEPFYRAEEYHQQYLKKRGLESCSID